MNMAILVPKSAPAAAGPVTAPFDANYVPYAATGTISLDTATKHSGAASVKGTGTGFGLSRTINFPATGTWTSDRWVRFTNITTNAGRFTLCLMADQGGAGHLVYVQWINYTDPTKNGITWESISRPYSVVTQSSFTIGAWYRVRIVIPDVTSNRYSVYVYNASGTLMGSTTSATTLTTGLTFANRAVTENIQYYNTESSAALWVDDLTADY